MFANRAWARLALFFNLLGTVVLFLSFQATSSNFKLITTSDGRSALCVNNRGIIISDPTGGFVIGAHTCPEWEHARAVAVVNVERPIFVTIGFSLATLGFLGQFLSLPSPKTIAQIRADLKLAKLKAKNKI